MNQWVKVNDRECLPNLEVNGANRQFPLRYEGDVEHLVNMIESVSNKSNFRLLFDNESAYSCYTSIREVFGKTVRLLYYNDYTISVMA